jgi:hypothetical protein
VDLAHLLALAQKDASSECLVRSNRDVLQIKLDYDARVAGEAPEEVVPPDVMAARLGVRDLPSAMTDDELIALPLIQELRDEALLMPFFEDDVAGTTIMAAAYAFSHGLWAVRTSTGRLLKAKFEGEGLRGFHAPLPHDSRSTWLAMGLLCAFLVRVWRYLVRLLFSPAFFHDMEVVPWRNRLQPLLAKWHVQDREWFVCFGRQIEALSVWCVEVMHPALRLVQFREMPGHAAFVVDLARHTAQVALAWHANDSLPQKLLPTRLGRTVFKRLAQWWGQNTRMIEYTELLTLVYPTLHRQYVQDLQDPRAGSCVLAPFWG